ncbi:septum formation initiator family protein [Kineococcus sp. SYSU DK018]|uniref:septum formation initiator family protein n=1 Tax=Kineococcus sp. SYSU DK018 TaxID=3383139 RepID=UPI003D7DDE56
MASRRPTAPRSTRRTAGAAGRSAGAGRGPGASRTQRPAAARPASRPAAAARGRSSATASAAARRTRGPRALVLSALVLVLAVFLLPSWQKWLEQRSEIGRLEATISQQREDLAAAQAQVERWEDDAYVVAQARSRLQYVLPGETPYVVAGGQDADAVAPAQAAAAVAESSAAWYENIWESLRVAATPGAADATSPGLTDQPATGTGTGR